MHKFIKIIKDSYVSHFDDTGTLVRTILLKTLPLNFLISASYVFIVRDISKDALNAIITLFSILIGFSYSVMIFLSANPRGTALDSSDREARLRWDRINGIAKNLYSNLNLFCFSAVVLVLVSLLGIAFQGSSLKNNYFYSFISPELALMMVNFVYVSVLLEICNEFYRILLRTNYLFSERIK